jgi:hypothetical protein
MSCQHVERGRERINLDQPNVGARKRPDSGTARDLIKIGGDRPRCSPSTVSAARARATVLGLCDLAAALPDLVAARLHRRLEEGRGARGRRVEEQARG